MKRHIMLAAQILCVGANFGATNDIGVLEQSETALRQLKLEPADIATLKTLPTLAAGASDDTIKGVLSATYALASLSSGDMGAAAKGTQWLAKQVPDSPYLVKLQTSSYQTDCPSCVGTGKASVPCPQCNARGACSRCAGKGSIPRLGGAAERCVGCGGSGKCKECSGTTQVAGKCQKCFASGHVLSIEAARQAYGAILDAAIPIVHTRLLTAKGLIVFEGREVTPSQREVELELRKAQAKAATAEAERKAAEERMRQAEADAQTAETRRQAEADRFAAEKAKEVALARQKEEEVRLQAERQKETEKALAERQRLDQEQRSAALKAGRAVEILNWQWTKTGFDIIMEASFTVRNNSSSDIKDITFRCVHAGKSGTKIDSNTHTVFDIIKAGETKQFRNVNMGFIDPQAASSRAEIKDYFVIK